MASSVGGQDEPNPALNHQLYHVNLKLSRVELMRKNGFKKDLLALPPRKCFHFYNIRK